MRFIYATFLFIFAALTSYSQLDTLPVRVAGIVFSDDSIQQTPYVHIINMRTGRGVISDSLGIFKTKILRYDTLRFTCIGFVDYNYTLPDSLESNLCLLSIKMSPTTYDLDVVDVLALSRRSQVKYDIINMEPPPLTWQQTQIAPGVYRGDYKFIREDEQPLGIQSFSPISAVYNALGGKGQSVNRLAQLLEQDAQEEVINRKYNRTKLQEFTNYHENKLDCFTMFLDFNPTYLYSESEYYIYYSVKQKMIPFEFKYRDDSLTMLLQLGK